MKKLLLLLLGLPFTSVQALDIQNLEIGQTDIKKINIIKANSRTEKQNKQHQIFCEQIGGRDITDKNNIKISLNTIDAIFCEIVNVSEFNVYSKKYGMAKARDIINENLRSQSEKSLDTSSGSWYAYAPSGTISGQYLATGSALFIDLYGLAHLDVVIPSDQCSVSIEKDVSGSLLLIGNVICENLSRGQQPSYANACLNGSCVQDQGWIIHQ